MSVRRRAGCTALALGILALLAGFAYFRSSRPTIEIAEGLDPDPIEPYGPANPEEIVFRWALPSDRVPVRVEVLDENATEPPLWVSDAVTGDSLRPPRGTAPAWPRGNLYWRPVAIAPDGTVRPGPLAAFLLPP